MKGIPFFKNFRITATGALQIPSGPGTPDYIFLVYLTIAEENETREVKKKLPTMLLPMRRHYFFSAIFYKFETHKVIAE